MLYPCMPKAPRPIGGGGCVDLAKVNARLLEIIRKTGVEQEEVGIGEEIAAKADVNKGPFTGENTLEKTMQEIEEKKERELPVPPVPPHRRIDTFTSRDSASQCRSKREQYPHGYIHSLSHHPSLQLCTSKSLKSLNYTTALSRSVSVAHSRVISSSPWSSQNEVHPQISHHLAPSKSPLQSYPEHRRGSNDRPDWSESDEAREVCTERFRLGAGLKQLMKKKSEGILRRGREKRARKALEVAGGVDVVGKRVVMRMQDDSVISRLRIWRRGCFMA